MKPSTYSIQSNMNAFLCNKLYLCIFMLLVFVIVTTHMDWFWYFYNYILYFLCISLIDFQLDAQNSYLFIYNTFIKILYMFQALPCSSSGGLLCNCIHAASGIITLCRWLSCALVKKQIFLNRCTGQSPADSDDTRGCMYRITG